MSDLIKRLRHARLSMLKTRKLRNEAADRIELLEGVLMLRGEHGEACTSRGLSDRGMSFVRHDWPCDCGIREALAAVEKTDRRNLTDIADRWNLPADERVTAVEDKT